MSVAQVGWWSVVGVARIDEEVLETDLTHKRRMHYIDWSTFEAVIDTSEVGRVPTTSSLGYGSEVGTCM